MAWWIGPSSDNNANLKADMQAASFCHDEFNIGMYCHLRHSRANEYNVPEELTIKRCNEPQDFADFGKVLASVFHPVDEYVKIFYSKVQNIPEAERNNLKLFVGYVHDKPVSTSGVFLTDVAGIYDVSTHPEMQNKGYGSAMFYKALKYAQDTDIQYGVLQASPKGTSIYQKFGFEQICTFNVWTP
ncbi:MAG: GNAT family N-acetyltransferase [Rickettsiaceae bacterium]